MPDAIDIRTFGGARSARRYCSRCICVSGRCEKLRPCRRVYKHTSACPISERSGRCSSQSVFAVFRKRLRVCLAEYGVDYPSAVSIDLIETGKYQNISRDFLRVNPGATVPVLLHNGHPVYESHEQVTLCCRASRCTSGWHVPNDPVRSASACANGCARPH